MIYSIMWKTDGLTVVQKSVINSTGRASQRSIVKELVVHRMLFLRTLMEHLVKEKHMVETGAQLTYIPCLEIIV